MSGNGNYYETKQSEMRVMRGVNLHGWAGNQQSPGSLCRNMVT